MKFFKQFFRPGKMFTRVFWVSALLSLGVSFVYIRYFGVAFAIHFFESIDQSLFGDNSYAGSTGNLNSPIFVISFLCMILLFVFSFAVETDEKERRKKGQ